MVIKPSWPPNLFSHKDKSACVAALNSIASITRLLLRTMVLSTCDRVKTTLEVGGCQDFLFSLLQPAFKRHVLTGGAVAVATCMVGDAHRAAMVAAIDMTAKIFGSAVEKIVDDFALLRP